MNETLALIHAVWTHRDADLETLLAVSPEAKRALEPKLAERGRRWLAPILQQLPRGDWERVEKALALSGWSGAELGASLVGVLHEQGACGWTRERTCELVDELERSGVFADPLGLTRGVSDDGLTRELVERGRVLALGRITGLSAGCLERAVLGGLRADQLGPAELARLVDDGTLALDIARRLGLAANLLAWTRDEAASRCLAEVELSSGPVSHVRDFARLSPEAWESVAKTADLCDAAGDLRTRLEAVFPAAAVLSRMPAPTPSALAADIKAMGETLYTDPSPLTGSLGADLSTPMGRIRQLERRFAHLEVASILTDPGATPRERADRVVARVQAVHLLSGASEGEALFELELDPGSDDMVRLAGQVVAVDELPGVVATLRSQRALVKLAGGVETAVALIDAGFSSGATIAKTPLKRLGAAAKLPADVAARIHQAAQGTVARWAGPTGMLLSIAGSGGLVPFRGANNVHPDAVDHLRQRPELADLLGRLDFCRCEHCQSLLSPAAYFVDLMLFVKEHVLDDSSYLAEDDAYHLRSRRPDLWNLKLDCDAIHGTLPTLSLVNDVLEQYIATAGVGICGVRDEPDVDARGQREREVYGTGLGGVLGPAAGTSVSVRQPSMLPLLEVDRLLGALDERRAAVVGVLEGASEARLAASLGVSQAELPLIRSDVFDTTRLFGSDAPSFPSSPPDASWIAGQLRMTRDELAVVLATRFVVGDDSPSIRSVRTEGALQPDREVVDGLTTATIGRLHRFVRLWRTSTAEPAELDVLLGALYDAAEATEWNDLLVDRLEQVATLCELGRARSISWEDLAALTGPMPLSPTRRGGTSLLERKFDGLLGGTFVHPHAVPPATAGAEAVARQTARLAGGCGMPADQLGLLIAGLRPALVPAAVDPTVAFDLDRKNLSLLYRHARVMALLGASTEELFTLLGLRGLTHLAGLSDLELLLDVHDAWKTSGRSLGELVWSLDPTRATIDIPSLADALVARTTGEEALLFAPTVLALAPGIGPDLSTRIVHASSVFVRHSAIGRFRLADGFDTSSPLPLPPGFVLSPEEGAALTEAAGAIAELLAPYHVSSVLAAAIAGPLDRSAAEVRLLAALSTLELGSPTLLHELLGEGEPVELRGVLTGVAHVSVTLSTWDASAFPTLLEHPDAAGFVAGVPPTWAGLTRLWALGAFLSAGGPTVRPARAAVVARYSSTSAMDAVSDEELAAAFGATGAFVRAADRAVGPRAHAIDGVTSVLTWVRAAQRLSVDIGALQRLAARYESWMDEFDAAVVVRDALRGAIAGRADEAPRIDLDHVENALRGDRRDALTEHLLTSESERFPRRSSLYHYFLVDTELEGCARTSCVVSATSALQVFVQRLTMGLEGSPDRTTDPGLVPADAWSWRRLYRPWEANRRIFLYPENYLLPELRDDKTPLFEALEADLLSSEVTPQRVLDAYATYVTGLDELGGLSIAGSYHERSETLDVLHLFGVNSEDPPIYYYRRIENLHAASHEREGRGVRFEPWRRIDAKIPVRVVAPKVVGGRLMLLWVETTTRHTTAVEGGTSRFQGYRHELSLRYAMMRLDGTWSPAQDIDLGEFQFPDGRGVVLDPLVSVAAANLQGSARGGDGLEDVLATALRQIGGTSDLAVFAMAHASTNSSLHARMQSFLSGWPLTDASFVRLVNDLLANGNLRASVAERDGRYPPAFHRASSSSPEPIDGYTLRGYLWDRVFPSGNAGELRASLAGFRVRQREVDLHRRQLALTPVVASRSWGKPAVVTLDRRQLRGVTPTNAAPMGIAHTPLSWATVWSSRERVRQLAYALDRHDTSSSATYTSHLDPWPALLTLTADGVLEPCGGLPQNVVLDVADDRLLLVGSPWEGESYDLRRLGSTLTEPIARTLSTLGIEGLLATEHQVSLAEGPAPVVYPSATAPGGPRFIVDRTGDGDVDFDGAFGVYYRELFFHIPFATASALHAAGDYASAQRWLHYIFDPSGAPLASDSVPLDRVWRYRELRGLDAETLRNKLSDAEALAAYENDPFNPHAIARLRLTAYQNAVVMKYMDVLLDWGDSLFSQFTRESVHEATLLYQLVSDLLGDRPVLVGDCLDTEAGTFEAILPALEEAGQSFASGDGPRQGVTPRPASKKSNEIMVSSPWLRASDGDEALAGVVEGSVAFSDTGTSATTSGPQPSATFNGTWGSARVESWGIDGLQHVGPLPLARLRARAADQLVGMGRQIGVFCVPPNPALLGYWDRVADRLLKIRNCLDINGQQRELPLFAPPIDPLLLARMRAAGLTLDDVLGGARGEVPPYRFSVLIGRARSSAGTLQSLGNELLGALEKRDNEQLSRIRNRHVQNLTRMGIRGLEQEVEAAGIGRELAEAQLEAGEHRRDYFRGLLDQGLHASERSQQDNTNLALTFQVQAAYWELIAGVVHLVPELGSPFALKFGGKQIGDAAGAVGSAFRTLGGIANASSQAASIEASFQRRQQGWQNELEVAERGVAQQKLQIEAAGLREAIAKHRLKSHEESLAQAEEVRDFFEDKLTGYGLFDWQAITLTRLYRAAFEGALAMAQLAERAYAFERLDDTTRLTHDYWDPAQRGLLAGERLAADLARIERRFTETDVRRLEIDQTLPLSQLDPDALWQLKQTGECGFAVGERFLDLSYPGHYRRRIKAVRLTIPAVIGPYTNVSATLELSGSRIRVNPGDAEFTELPTQHTSRIATSRAQNDGGMFELSFNDPRYLPFEGAGAISDWTLRLPRTFRTFDYQAIDDVLIHIAYTARHDEPLRERNLADAEALRDAVVERLGTQPFVRVISFRHEMGPSLRRVLDAPAGTAIPFSLRREHLPYYLRDLPLVVERAILFVRGAPADVSLLLDGAAVTGFSTDGSDSLWGTLPGRDVTSSFSGGWMGEHTIAGGGTEPPVAEDVLLAFTLRMPS